MPLQLTFRVKPSLQMSSLGLLFFALRLYMYCNVFLITSKNQDSCWQLAIYD